MSNALGLAAGMLLDGWLGEPRWLWNRLPHPAVLMGRAVGALERRWNTGRHRKAKGVAAMLVLAAGALALGALLELGGVVVQTLCVAVLLAQKSLAQHVSAVAAGLRLSVGEGRRAVAMIVSRDTADMDASQVARAAIESGAENFSDGVIAPAFWFLVGGLPGLLLYKVTNTADSMVGYRNTRYAAYGWAAARLDDLLNLVPARLTALILVLLSGQWTGWGAMIADARRHRSPNAGWPEAVMARALDVALAGPRSYDGQLRHLAWVNAGGRKSIGPAEIDGAVSLLWRAWWAVMIFTIFVACGLSFT